MTPIGERRVGRRALATILAMAILLSLTVVGPARAITGTVTRVNESFEGATFPPTDWTVGEIFVDGDGDPPSWTHQNCPAPDATAKCAKTTGFSGNSRIETPTFSTAGLPTPKLEFTLYVDDPSYDENGGSPTSDATLTVVRRTSFGLDQFCQVYPSIDTFASTLPANCPSATVVDDLSNPNKKTVTMEISATSSHSFGFSFSNPDFGGSPVSMWIDDVKVTATTVNEPPVANDVNVGSFNEGPKNITLNGTDTDGDPLTYTVLTQPTHGTLSGTPPNLLYTSNDNTGSSDSFTYKVNDTEDDSAAGTVSLSPIPINDAPAAAGPSVATTDDQTNVVFSAANGNRITMADPDAGSNDIQLFMSVPIGKGTLTLGSQPAGLTVDQTHPSRFIIEGTVAEINTAIDGVTFDPIAPLDEAITLYMEWQDFGNSGTGVINGTGNKSITITVGNVNTPPTAESITLTTFEDTPISARLDGMDLDGDTMTYSIVSQPAHGTLSQSFLDSFPGLLEISLLYTPEANYFGTDSFTYKLNDGEDDSAVGTVTITITDVPEPFFAPMPVNDTLVINEDEVGNITLKAFNMHPQMTWTVGMAAVGTTSASGPSVTYTPRKNFHGQDIFYFYVEAPKDDGSTFRSGLAQVNVTVTPVNDRPTVKDGEVSLRPGQTKAVVLEAEDVDNDPLTPVDEDPLTYKITSPAIPAFYGKLTGTAPNLKFVADPQTLANGSAVSMLGGDLEVTYTVTDKGGLVSDPATFTIHLRADQPDLTIQSDTDDFALGSYVYNDTGDRQTSKTSLAFQESNIIKFHVVNAGTSTDDYLFRGTMPANVVARYLDPAGNDITSQMTFTGYLMEDVAEGETRTITAVLTPQDAGIIGQKRSLSVTATSIADPDRADTVVADLRLRPAVPDLLGAVRTEVFGDGKNGEMSLARARPNQSSFGRMLVENDGGTPGTFLIEGEKLFLPNDVEVTFSNSLGTDITSQILGTGYEMKNMAPAKFAKREPIYIDVEAGKDVDGKAGMYSFTATSTDDPDVEEGFTLNVPVGAGAKADVYVEVPRPRGFGYRDPVGKGVQEPYGQPSSQWAGEFVDVGASRGKTFVVHVANDAKLEAEYLLSVPVDPTNTGFGWSMSDYAGQDITGQVAAGTYKFSVPRESAERFYLTTTFTRDVAANEFRSALMQVRAMPVDGGSNEADNFAFSLTPRTSLPDVSVKEQGGATAGTSVFGGDPNLQKVMVDMAPNQKQTVVFNVRNASIYQDTFNVYPSIASVTGFRVDWSYKGGRFIGGPVTLPAGGSAEFNATVTAPGASKLQLTQPVTLKAESADSALDPAPSDIAQASMNLGFASDLSIQKLSSTGSPNGPIAGAGVVDPANPQVLSSTQGPLSKAKYRVRVTNTGVSRDRYILLWKKNFYTKDAHAYNAAGNRQNEEPVDQWLAAPADQGEGGRVTRTLNPGETYDWTIEISIPPITSIADKQNYSIDVKLISGVGVEPTVTGNVVDAGGISAGISSECVPMTGTFGTVEFKGDCMQRVDTTVNGQALKGWFSKDTMTINGLDFTPMGNQDMLFVNELDRTIKAVREKRVSLSDWGYVSIKFTGTDRQVYFGGFRSLSLGTAGSATGTSLGTVAREAEECRNSSQAQNYEGVCDRYDIDYNPAPTWSVYGGLTYRPGTEVVTITMPELGKSTVQVALAPPPAMSGKPQPVTLGTDPNGLVAAKPKDVEYPLLRFGSLGMADARMTWDDKEAAWIGYARVGLPAFPIVPGIEGVFLVRGDKMYYCYIRMKLGVASIPLAPGVTLDEVEGQATQENGFSTYGKITIGALKVPIPNPLGADKEIQLLKLKGRYSSVGEKVTLQGQAAFLGLFDFQTFNVTFSPEGMRMSGEWNYSVDLGSFMGISLGRLGIKVNLEGGAAANAFEMTGSGKVYIFGQGPSLSGILSTKGVAGCAGIDLPSPIPDVSAGVGIDWSGSVSVMATGCSIDGYKEPSIPGQIDFAAIESRIKDLLLKGDVTRQMMDSRFLAVASALGKS